jgi:hypothetical protein
MGNKLFGDTGMTTCVKLFSAVLYCVAFLLTAPASAEQIYRWVGDDGATHFSETPPAVDSADVEVLEVIARQRVGAPTRDYRSALEVAKDIESSRLERERLRLEKKQLRLQNQQLRESRTASPDFDEDYRGVYYTPYYRYPPKPHRRHPYHRPVYPEPYASHRYGRPGHRSPQGRVHIRQ